MTYAEFLHVCRHINADTAGDLLGHMLLQVSALDYCLMSLLFMLWQSPVAA